MNLEFRVINEENIDDVVDLKVKQDQEQFVASNLVSLAEAYAYKAAWPRAIYLQDKAVGFVMLADPSFIHDHAAPAAELWRFMIDHQFQGKGIGKATLDKVVEHVKARGYTKLYASYVPGSGGPELFYKKYGFKPTGEMDHDEVITLLEL